MLNQGNKLESFKIYSKRVIGSKQQNIEYSDGGLSGSLINDIEFRNCVFDGVVFSRTIFSDCKFESVEIRNCKVAELDFNNSELKNVTISNSSLFELDFTDTELDDVLFDNCEFESGTFLRASLKSVSTKISRSVGLPSHTVKLKFVDEKSSEFLSKLGFKASDL